MCVSSEGGGAAGLLSGPCVCASAVWVRSAGVWFGAGRAAATWEAPLLADPVGKLGVCVAWPCLALPAHTGTQGGVGGALRVRGRPETP